MRGLSPFAAAVFRLLLLCPGVLSAAVRLPALFSDHMVLQQDLALPIWGWAAPGERVEVRFAGQIVSAYADANGRWRVHLDPVESDHWPRVMEIEGTNRLMIKDVLVGDVWLCSGQSNMEYGLTLTYDAAEAVPRADDPELRLFDVEMNVAFSPAEDCVGRWVVCTPETVATQGRWKGFSAVGYHFGREIRAARGQPVGLIASAVGGTAAEAWTSRAALAAQPGLATYAQAFDRVRTQLPQLEEDYETRRLPEWQRARATWKALPVPRPPMERRPQAPARSARQPVVLHNGMIQPLVGYGIKGVIWYQGESNATTLERAQEYATLFPVMMADWRQRWGQGDFPFLFVQLAGWGRGEFYPELREAQDQALTVPATGMAVALDVGEQNDIHPRNKRVIGHRLALAARHLVYGEDVAWSGPSFRRLEQERTRLRLFFDHTDGGLIIGAPEHDGAGRVPARPDRLSGFQVASATMQWVDAEARIEGDTIVVWSEQQPMPVAVRYGWAPFPDPPANLCNGAGLPARPFRSIRP